MLAGFHFTSFLRSQLYSQV